MCAAREPKASGDARSFAASAGTVSFGLTRKRFMKLSQVSYASEGSQSS
jgi:hypothetical protein